MAVSMIENAKESFPVVSKEGITVAVRKEDRTGVAKREDRTIAARREDRTNVVKRFLRIGRNIGSTLKRISAVARNKKIFFVLNFKEKEYNSENKKSPVGLFLL